MASSLGRCLSQRYGFDIGVTHKVGTPLLGLTPGQQDFADSLLPECWFAMRADVCTKKVQLSIFLVCDHRARLGARMRARRKCSELSYMRDAEMAVSHGCPLAHCTVSFHLRGIDTVRLTVDFLEKDHQRRPAVTYKGLSWPKVPPGFFQEGP